MQRRQAVRWRYSIMLLYFIHVSTQTFWVGVKSELLTGKINNICKKSKMNFNFFLIVAWGFRLFDPLLSFYSDI